MIIICGCYHVCCMLYVGIIYSCSIYQCYKSLKELINFPLHKNFMKSFQLRGNDERGSKIYFIDFLKDSPSSSESYTFK